MACFLASAPGYDFAIVVRIQDFALSVQRSDSDDCYSDEISAREQLVKQRVYRYYYGL